MNFRFRLFVGVVGSLFPRRIVASPATAAAAAGGGVMMRITSIGITHLLYIHTPRESRKQSLRIFDRSRDCMGLFDRVGIRVRV